MPPNTVYVGRPSKWGNPYTLDKYNIVDTNDKPVSKAVHDREARLMAVRDHDAWVGLGYAPYTLEDIRRELGGKNLACWCALDQECHADTLLAIANS